MSIIKYANGTPSVVFTRDTPAACPFSFTTQRYTHYSSHPPASVSIFISLAVPPFFLVKLTWSFFYLILFGTKRTRSLYTFTKVKETFHIPKEPNKKISPDPQAHCQNVNPSLTRFRYSCPKPDMYRNMRFSHSKEISD